MIASHRTNNSKNYFMTRSMPNKSRKRNRLPALLETGKNKWINNNWWSRTGLFLFQVSQFNSRPLSRCTPKEKTNFDCYGLQGLRRFG